MVKVSGADFKGFYKDPAVWPDSAWYEDAAITVNGLDAGEMDLSKVADADVVTVCGGYICRDMARTETAYWRGDQRSVDFEATLRQWMGALTHVLVVVQVPKDQLSALCEIAAERGWTVR